MNITPKEFIAGPTMEIVIQFTPDGAARCLHTDALSLAEIGTMTATRASTVEFNEKTQKWEVRFTLAGDADYSNGSRAECLAWERHELNRRLLDGR